MIPVNLISRCLTIGQFFICSIHRLMTSPRPSADEKLLLSNHTSTCNSKMSTARPDVKRVRSDQDHSKKDTKDREDKRQKSPKDGEQKDDKEDNKDEDWLSQPPFIVGQSWDDWTTVWRQSCWCGKGEP